MITFLSIFGSVFILDLITKMFVRAHLPIGAEVPVLPVFSLVHVQNTGIAFGLFPDKNVTFIVIGLVMTIVIVNLAKRHYATHRAFSLTLAAVLGGAWGNLVDRIFFGRVTDFLDVFVGAHHWPAFNVADAAICIGAGLLLMENFRKPSTEK